MSGEKPNRPVIIMLKRLPPDYEWTVHVPGGGKDIELEPVDPPDNWEKTTAIEVEVRKENPRWVKIGGRWYYIG